MGNSFQKIHKENYLSEVFENNVEYAIEILELYKKLVLGKKEKLIHHFNNRKKDEFYAITRQIMTSFKMIGFPELADQLHDFAADYKLKGQFDGLDVEFVAILNKIDLTIPFVENELNKLKNLPLAQ